MQRRVLAQVVTASLAAASAVASPACAAAAAPPAASLTVLAQPSGLGSPSHLKLDAKLPLASLGAPYPQGITLALFKDFSLDLDGAARCAARDAAAGTCPAASRIAAGQISAATSVAGLLPMPVTAPLGVYLALPGNGDLADVIIEVTAQGTTQATRGQLFAVSDPTFGYELRLDPLASVTAPLSTMVSVTELTLDIGAAATGPATAPAATTPPAPLAPFRRPLKCTHGRSHGKCKKQTHKKARRRRNRRLGHRANAKKATFVTATTASTTVTAAVTHNLISNPVTCGGSWPVELRIRFADHTQVLDAAIACAAP